MTRSIRLRRCALLAASALALAASCGGDDDATDDAATDAAGADDAGADEPDAGDASDAGDGSDAVGGSGDPATLLADDLHPLELPEPGTAVVTLAGETYVFDELNTCGINDGGEGRRSFVAIGGGELADGTRTRFDVSRYVVDVDALAAGDWHERDFLQMTVEQEPGGGLFSNSIHDVHREVPGGPVDGDGDVTPVIRVVDDGEMVAATGVAEVTHPPFTGEYDRAGEGVGEFAVVCG